MKKWFCAILCVLLLIGAANAQMLTTGAGKKPAGAAAATTYDPSNKGANVTLSNGNLTAELAAVGYLSVRTIGSKSSGKCYYTVTIDVQNFGTSIGFVNSSFSITGGGQVGTDNNGLGWIFNSGNVIVNNIGIGTGVTYGTAGDVPNIAIDFGAQKVWVRLGSGNWNNDILANQNPATGTGGFSFSGIAAGPYYMAATGGNTNDKWTANFGGSAFSPAAPSGFGNC